MFCVFGTGTEGIVQLIVAMLMFLFVIILCYAATKFIATYQKKIMSKGNIEVVEVKRISNNKFLEIVKIGKEYLVLGVSKDNISMITKIEKEDLIFPENNNGDSFNQIFERVKKIKSKDNKGE